MLLVNKLACIVLAGTIAGNVFGQERSGRVRLLVQSAPLAWGLDRGAGLQARVSRLAPHPNPARRVEIEVFVE